MWNTVFAFIPMATALAGTVAFILKKTKSYSQTLFTILLAFMTLYFLSDGFYMLRDVNYRNLVKVDLLSQFATPAVLSIAMVCVRAFFHDVVDRPIFIVSLLPAFILGCGSFILYSTIGVNDCAAFFQALDNGDLRGYNSTIWMLLRGWTYHLYMTVIVTEMIALLILMIHIRHKHNVGFKGFLDFLFKNGRYSLRHAIFWFIMAFAFICAIRIGMGRAFLLAHPALSATLSVLTAVTMAICIRFAYFPRVSDITLKEAFKGQYPPPDPKNLLYGTLDAGTITRLSIENNARLVYLLLIEKKYWMVQHASAADAAKKIGISTRRLQTVVLTMCSCNFETLLEHCRAEAGSQFNEL